MKKSTAVLSLGVVALLASAALLPAAAPATNAAPPARGRGGRGGPPARDPSGHGYVKATELPDGTIPKPTDEGNFIIGPTHTRAPEMNPNPAVPKGDIKSFVMRSQDSKIYPGIAKVATGTVDPEHAERLIVTTHPAPWQRTIRVYIPKQYVAGTPSPVLVTADGDTSPFTALDNLIAAQRVPPMICVAIPNGGNDAQGSQRGLEYDTMSGKYAEWVETEVLPRVESECNVKISKDPEARATMGGSSGGSCALAMAWYHPEWYHRVLTYSGTYVNQQWPYNAETPHGAWEFHEHLIPDNPVKPIRIWMEVGDRDLLNPNVMRDDMHDWVEANERMAKVLADKGYHYQFIFSRNAGHVDGPARNQTLPEALEWLWQGYKAN